MHFTRLFVSLASPKVLPLGNEKKSELFFCISLAYSYLCSMKELNLPGFDIKMRGTREKPEIFDFLRRKYVALTPEEWVRQHFTHWLVVYKGYPKGLLGNEIAMKCGEKTLRCDSILYDKESRPQMIIEYKAPTVPVTQRVFNQISAYNLLLHVDYLVVSNGCQHYCCRMNYEKRTFEFLQDIPDYSDISQE